MTIEPIWVNYHKHTSLSNRYIKDSAVVNKDYWDELRKRYGDNPCIFTTVEHGWQSNYFHTYNELEKYNKKNGTNIKFVFGTEAYWVKDRHEKDNSNCHIILLARNDNGRKAINKILSIANKDGYYYRPRIDLELIRSLPPNDVFITTACIAYHNKYNDIDDITLSLANQFPHFYLEIQAHDTKPQIELNQHLLDLSKKHNIPLIAGCDSHYITMGQAIDRDMLLESSNVHYEDEDGWVIDYPTYDTLFKRFQNQSIFTDDEIKIAINNTNEIFNFEPIILDRSLKVPVIKPLRNKSQEERNKIFENILHNEWEKQKWDINQDKHDEYIKEIKDGIKEIEACNMADYFILSYAVMRLGQEKYGGILTPTGRGSAVGMYLNKLLRLTKVDKVNSPVLMYSERFLTKERILESHVPPDVDNNVSDRQPFIEAQKELVGELGTYDLLAMGTMKKKAAWKMYARANNVDPQIANQVSYQIGDYEEALKYADDGEEVNFEDFIQPEFKQLISECAKYFGIYDNAKGHPCGCLCLSDDIEAEIGITLCKSDATGNEVLVAIIESGDIDSFGYLKQDYLIVDSIGLTYDIYKEIGIEPYTVNQLLDKIKTDKATWDIYKDGYTQCVNQCEQAKSTLKVQKYQPKNISELTQFIAAIRPGFKSMYHTFESRQHFEYGIKALDELIQDEFRSSSFIIYQEDLMKVLGFAGFPMAETYTIVKAISKKKDYVIKEAKSKFIPRFSAKIMDSDDKLSEKDAIAISEKVWGIIEDNAAYGFNCVSGDTIIKKPGASNKKQMTVEEMYLVMNDKEYAIQTGHKHLRDKYLRYGYGYGFSMVDGRIYKNKIVDIYKQEKATIYSIKTIGGREIKTTINHKFPTPDGTKTVEQLNIGDSLYIYGKREPKKFNSRLTESFENNFPIKGQCGFQTKENGDSVVFERFRELNKTNKTSCQCCNKLYSEEERFEVHHKDFDRTHNEESNYEWLCCSCHKKKHYEHGRTKQYENGILVDFDIIESIEPCGYKAVYDIEMSGDVAHNFVVDNGLVTCNSAHSYCMAIDSVTIAYLKAHYPLEFYKCVLQRFTNKGDKDKVSLIKQEMIKRGFYLNEIQFGQDNRQFTIDKSTNSINQCMTSIKSMPKTAPQALYELGQKGIKRRTELYQALMDDNRINIKAIDILFKLDYFSKFSHPNRLLTEYSIYEQNVNKKTINKSKLSDDEIELIRQCAGKETEKQFKEIDNHKLIFELIKKTDVKPTTNLDKIRYQFELLGYSTIIDNSVDSHIWIVLSTNIDKWNRKFVEMYNVCYGAIREYRINNKFKIKDELNFGDCIKCVLSQKPKKRKTAEGNFVDVPNEFVTEIKCYKILDKYIDKQDKK